LDGSKLEAVKLKNQVSELEKERNDISIEIESKLLLSILK
jgi:hypothetical protein